MENAVFKSRPPRKFKVKINGNPISEREPKKISTCTDNVTPTGDEMFTI